MKYVRSLCFYATALLVFAATILGTGGFITPQAALAANVVSYGTAPQPNYTIQVGFEGIPSGKSASDYTVTAQGPRGSVRFDGPTRNGFYNSKNDAGTAGAHCTGDLNQVSTFTVTASSGSETFSQELQFTRQPECRTSALVLMNVSTESAANEFNVKGRFNYVTPNTYEVRTTDNTAVVTFTDSQTNNMPRQATVHEDGTFSIRLAAGTYNIHGRYKPDPNEALEYSFTQNNVAITEDTDLGNLTISVSGNISDDEPGARLESEEGNSCESQGSLQWIMCPLVDTIAGILNWIDSQIQGLLEVNEETYANENLRRAWANIRNIAYVVLIPIMLVMVIGTALGFEVFSAYTVKKALPRMVISVIFITFSWHITTFIIGFFNVLGAGILGLMTSPFGQAGNMSLDTLFGPGVATTAAQYAALGGLGYLIYLFIFSTSGAGAGIMLLYLGGALLVVATAFLILILRQMFIIALTLVAPLAILAWIFPGNDKLWKLWWGTFTKLLMMFPLIMAVIAAGRIFAYVIGETGGGDIDISPIVGLLKLSAYILPYLFIPFAFKFAGGLFANLAGMMNDRERGLFDRMRKGRQSLGQQIHERTMDGKNRLSQQRAGRAYTRLARFGRDGSFGLTRGQRSRWAEYNMRSSEQTADKMLEEGAARGFNDDDATNLAKIEGMTRERFLRDYAAVLARQGRGADDSERQRLALDALNRTELAAGAKIGTSAMAKAALKFRIAMTNTAYEPGVAGLEAMQQDIQRAIQSGAITEVDAAGWMKANRGRADYSANGFNETVQFAAGRVTAAQQLAGAFAGADPREVVGGHQRAVESFAQQAQMNLSDALANFSQAQTSGNDQEKRDAQAILDKSLADVANIYDTLSNISPRKAEEWANNVYAMSSGIEREVIVPSAPASGPQVLGPNGQPLRDESATRRERRTLSVRELMEESRGNNDFLDRRREYASARDAVNANRTAEAVQPPEQT